MAVKIQVEVLVSYRTLHGVTTQKTEEWGSMDFWNVGILPQHYTASQPRRLKMEAAWTCETSVSYRTLHGVTTQKTEEWGSMDLWNVGILPQHYTVSQPRRLKMEAENLDLEE
jgi:hypothetical protein